MNNFEYIKHLASLELEEFKKSVKPDCKICAYSNGIDCKALEDISMTCQKGFELWLESECETNE